jgi:N-formylglutamate deformylase
MSHPAYLLTVPKEPHVPVVFDSPHSGTEYPADFAYASSHALLREAEDTFVDDLYSAAPAHGAALLAATFPRSYIDANRSMLDVDNTLFEKPWPGPVSDSPKIAQGIGLVWRLLDNGDPIYQRKLTHAEVMQRISQYHQPYQRALKDALDAAYERFGGVWHINCHSMGAVGGKGSEDAGRERADFVLGDRDGTTAAREFTQTVYSFLRGAGYSVKINDPYKGVELVRAFSDPDNHRHSLQVEINRRLYLNERTRERTGNYERLKADISRLVAFVCEYAGHAADSLALTCHDPHHHHGHGHAHEHHDHHDHSHCDHDHGHCAHEHNKGDGHDHAHHGHDHHDHHHHDHKHHDHKHGEHHEHGHEHAHHDHKHDHKQAHK